VPVTLICPEFSPAEARQWTDGGEVEVAKARHVEYVDIESGHWRCSPVRPSSPTCWPKLLRRSWLEIA
jgi:hypothetical protein